MPVFFCLGLDSVEGEFAWNLRIWGNITIVSCTFFRESVEYRSWNWQIENPQFPIHKRKPFLVNLILTQQFYNIHTYIHTYVYYNILWRFEILVKPGKFFSSYLRFFFELILIYIIYTYILRSFEIIFEKMAHRNRWSIPDDFSGAQALKAKSLAHGALGALGHGEVGGASPLDDWMVFQQVDWRFQGNWFDFDV